jgi:hypothetical protein
MTGRCAERLAERAEPHAVLSGDYALCLARAAAAVEALLARGWRFG